MLRGLGLALWVVIALSVGSDLLLRLSLAIADRRLLVVTSGSMRPVLEAGDAVVIDPFRGAVPVAGDVVVFDAPGASTPTAHRVVSLHEVDGHLFLRTRGDHNAAPDPNLVAVEAVSGRVSWRLPFLGHWLRWYDQPRVRFGIVALLALPVAVGELGSLRAGISLRAKRSGTHE